MGVRIFFFYPNFCLYYLGGHAKFQIPTICPYWGLATAATRRRKEKRKNSAHADGGPRSRVCARETLLSAWFAWTLALCYTAAQLSYYYFSSRQTLTNQPVDEKDEENSGKRKYKHFKIIFSEIFHLLT